jgi:hypothetical protein
LQNIKTISITSSKKRLNINLLNLGKNKNIKVFRISNLEPSFVEIKDIISTEFVSANSSIINIEL